jgi:glycosyltransferase involved in cell wall biosynthesis
MRCDTHLGLPCSGVKAVLRKPLLSILYSQCDGFLAIGTANKRFYLAMGVPEQKISLVPFTVDNARFMEKPRLSRNDRLAARERYGIATNRPAILYVSKFIRRKHPDHLVLAAQRLAAEGLSFDLVLAGSGEMRTELEALIARGGPPHIVMPGFINQQDMPKLLGACDLFVLPSENEPWGLIVNEAMCAGLPIVVSAAAGCATDLVRQGENGFVFAAGSVDALADALRPIITDAGLRQSMSRKSIEIIEGWNYGRCLDGLRDAVARCCRDPKRYVPNWPEARAMKRTCK